MEVDSKGIGELCAQDTSEINCSVILPEMRWLDDWAKLLDMMHDGLKGVTSPKLDVGVFDMPDTAQIGVSIIPSEITNIISALSKRDFGFKVRIVSAAQKTQMQIQGVMTATKCVISVLDAMKTQKMFSYQASLKILASNEAEITLMIMLLK